jgi:hypothetical protein
MPQFMTIAFLKDGTVSEIKRATLAYACEDFRQVKATAIHAELVDIRGKTDVTLCEWDRAHP